MSGTQTSDISMALTAGGSTNGLLTVASTDGLYVKMQGWIQPAASDSTAIIITEIVSATQIRVRIRQIPDNYSLVPAKYGTSNMSSFLAGAKLCIPGQLIYGV